ncbi:2-hydroxyacid dehydrogenase [Cellulosimicrobium cellulans]|uniref:2-hydroxyacid dehydrogenase n=1 Tax=Cellulosimicrobium cellulans TaxID=1710 RepID=UPI0037F1AAD8
MKILAAGDGFVTNALLAQELSPRVPGAEIHTLELPWPRVPFGPVAEVSEASGTQESLIAALEGIEVLVTQMAPITRRVLSSAPDLRLVVVCRGGPVNVNLDAAREAGVQVRTTPGRNAPAAAEHTIALMMAALRNIPELDRSMRAGEWRGGDYQIEACGSELAGATVGLIGYGAIGRRVARILSAFGARVLVHDPYAEAIEYGEQSDLDGMLRQAAVVSLHARLTDETRHIIDAAALRRMRPGAVLVNTARGGLVDQDALVTALRTGGLGAAAVDVYDPEPPAVDDAIRQAPRLVMTPHLAGATRQTAERAAALSADAVLSYTSEVARRG